MDESHTTKPAGPAVGADAPKGDVCPSKRKQLDLATAKEQIEETTGPEYCAASKSWRAAKNFRKCCTGGVPQGGFGVARRLLAPRIPQDHGRVARARRC